jgi:hypothetical protein
MADNDIPERRARAQQAPLRRAEPGCERNCPICTVRCAVIVRMRDELTRDIADLTSEIADLSRQLAAADATFLRIGPPVTRH